MIDFKPEYPEEDYPHVIVKNPFLENKKEDITPILFALSEIGGHEYLRYKAEALHRLLSMLVGQIEDPILITGALHIDIPDANMFLFDLMDCADGLAAAERKLESQNVLYVKDDDDDDEDRSSKTT